MAEQNNSSAADREPAAVRREKNRTKNVRWRQKNRERTREIARAFYNRNPDRLRAKALDYSRRPEVRRRKRELLLIIRARRDRERELLGIPPRSLGIRPRRSASPRAALVVGEAMLSTSRQGVLGRANGLSDRKCVLVTMHCDVNGNVEIQKNSARKKSENISAIRLRTYRIKRNGMGPVVRRGSIISTM